MKRKPSLCSFIVSRLIVIGCFLLGQPLVYGQLNIKAPAEIEGVTVEQRLGERLPLSIAVTDSDGKTALLRSYFDGKRPVLVTLNYSNCPVLCSVQLNHLTASLNDLSLRLKDDYQVLTVSIDPQESRTRIEETKQLYIDRLGKQAGASDGWHFATASQEAITQLADALGFRYVHDKKTGQYFHPAMLAFVSPDGIITRYSLKVDFPPDQMKLALLESADGTIGSAVDQFVLWCFSYDPERGRYTAEAWKLMRTGGLATVLVLAAGITPYWIGRRRNAENNPNDDENEKAAV